MRIGTHWPEPNRIYPRHTPTVELAYCLAPVGDAHHPSSTMQRIETYAAQHPEARVILRLDYKPWESNQRPALSYPHDPEDQVWRDGFKNLHWLRHLGDRLVLQVGNEPQLEGADNYEHVLRAYWSASVAIREALPDALLGTIPIATFHGDRMGASRGCSPEGSPWADLDFALKDRMLHDQGVPLDLHPDIDILHVYGDGAKSVEADAQSRDSHGWRFGINIAETWAENRQALGIDQPIMIGEFNTSARGTNPPHRPSDNYRAGWLREAQRYLARVLPACEALCWFVGSVEGRGEYWAPFSVDRRYHRGSLGHDFTEALR